MIKISLKFRPFLYICILRYIFEDLEIILSFICRDFDKRSFILNDRSFKASRYRFETEYYLFVICIIERFSELRFWKFSNYFWFHLSRFWVILGWQESFGLGLSLSFIKQLFQIETKYYLFVIRMSLGFQEKKNFYICILRYIFENFEIIFDDQESLGLDLY